MKRVVIAILAVLMMGNVLAQDNKVKVVKLNTEMIKRADDNTHCRMNKECKMMKLKADSVRVMEKCQRMQCKKGEVMEGKSLKLKDVRDMPVKPKKVKPIKK